MEQKHSILARPIRILPFDLGRPLGAKDMQVIHELTDQKYRSKSISPRQQSIIKDCFMALDIDTGLSAYIYNNGICVITIEDTPVSFAEDYQTFSIAYGDNRKKAHSQLFKWCHPASQQIDELIRSLRGIVISNNKKNQTLRISASEDFENKGMSYVMTLSLFNLSKELLPAHGYKNYPRWLKTNICAMLDPALLYLEDSSKFESANEVEFDIKRILSELEVEEELRDYEKHRHVDTYMSWAAVLVIGDLQHTDIEEYTALEVQLQCDWYYVYCMEKSLEGINPKSKTKIIDYQKCSYELDVLENRLYDFDDSSMPARILEVQKGLVKSSSLQDNINHLQRKLQYLLEREKIDFDMRQKKVGQSTEVLLFVVAFVEVAPTIAEWGSKYHPLLGPILNALIVALGIILFMRKER